MPNNSYETIGLAMRRVPVAKTADYKVKLEDIGTIFSNKGASGAVEFTLPDATAAGAGWFCEFFVVADQTLKVTSTPADKMVVFNDAAADSISFATAGEKVGNWVKVVSDGALWYTAIGFSNIDTAITLTIAT